MKIPVFVSCPTSLSPLQETARSVIVQQLDDNDLEPRALGRSDYPTDLPLREVLLIGRHCSGGIISRRRAIPGGERSAKTGDEGGETRDHRGPFPTAWNHLESGILFGLRLPILVFREEAFLAGSSTMVFPMFSFIQFRRPISPAAKNPPSSKSSNAGPARFGNITTATRAVEIV